MKTKAFSIAIPLLLLATSCKKNYTCACTNPGGTTNVFTVKDTKSNAEKKCNDYFNTIYGNIVMSETSCAIK